MQVTLMTSVALVPEVPDSGLLVLSCARSQLPVQPGDLDRLADAARLSTLVRDALAAALAHELDAENPVPVHPRHQALLTRIHAFVEENLGDPNLTPASIAAAHHISLRYLHKLFHGEDRRVARWIRELRLDRCRRDLADPVLATEPISAIAARWGFTNPAHFSQAFRAVYGQSPRDYRKARTARAVARSR